MLRVSPLMHPTVDGFLKSNPEMKPSEDVIKSALFVESKGLVFAVHFGFENAKQLVWEFIRNRPDTDKPWSN